MKTQCAFQKHLHLRARSERFICWSNFISTHTCGLLCCQPYCVNIETVQKVPQLMNTEVVNFHRSEQTCIRNIQRCKQITRVARLSARYCHSCAVVWLLYNVKIYSILVYVHLDFLALPCIFLSNMYNTHFSGLQDEFNF